MVARTVKVIIDYDGTLTYEERYVEDLAEKALQDLAENILHVPEEKIKKLYQKTKEKILQNPEKYSWIVNGLPACYACEGALLLNTVTTQTIIKENKNFKKAVEKIFSNLEYDPVVDCTNYLFHKHSFDLIPHFKEKAGDVLIEFIKRKGIEPFILTCSQGDKVAKNLKRIGINTSGRKDGTRYRIRIFGDTRQYEMDPSWDYFFDHPQLGKTQVVPVNDQFSIDLRRSVYFNKLQNELSDGSRIIIAADMVSLPGVLPLLMGLDFVLVKASYTPQWAVDFVNSWKNGWVINEIGKLPTLVDKIMVNWFLKNQL